MEDKTLNSKCEQKTAVFFVNNIDSLWQFRLELMLDLRKNGYRVIACTPTFTAKNNDFLIKHKIEIIQVKLSRCGINIFEDIKTFWSFYLLLRKIKPDFIINYAIKPVIYGSLAAFLARTKSIYSVITGLGYMFMESGFKGKIISSVAKFLYGFSLKSNRKVFFLNQDNMNSFLSYRLVKKEQAVLIDGEGVNVEVFKPTTFPNYCTFLLIARMLKAKGIFEYLKAAEIIKNKYPNVIFKLVGAFGDPNPNALHQSEIMLWLQRNVVDYLGELDQIKDVIASSSVYVLPSYYHEGMSHTILEAMSMGRAIITTDMPGCRETVTNGVNDFLVPVKNVEKLAEVMEKFILHPKLIHEMGEESRRTAIERFDVRKVNEIILNFLIN